MKFYLRKGLMIVVVTLFLTMLFVPTNYAKASTTGITYYVDSVDGNDAHDGKSQSTAWKTISKLNGITFSPGDQILFKAGGIWNGELILSGSGEEGNPIVIDKYGTGNKPQLVGNENANQVIKIENVEYWSINNLDISANYTSELARRAIYIHGVDYGTIDNLHFKNLDIHDVKNNKTYTGNNSAKDTGGIFCWIESPKKIETKFNDILIENCTFKNLDREGITLTWSDWGTRQGMEGGNPWIGSTNVVIRNNYFNNIGGDGIVVSSCDGALVEYNTIDGFAERSQGVSYNAGMWAFNADNTIFQYNEGFNGKTTMDGMPWDADAATNGTIYQYNYSHDNAGGAMLFISYPGTGGMLYSKDAIFRYNISQNDRAYLITATKPVNGQVYNNVFYTKSGITTQIFNTKSGTLAFKNNIFYNEGGSVGGWSDYTYDHNVFYGNYSSLPNDAHKITENPQLVNPGSGGNGINTVGGYKLQPTSPCINAGVTIANNGGKDYWGNTVPYNNGATDIGVHELQQDAPTPPSNLAKGLMPTSNSYIVNNTYATDEDINSNNVTGIGENLAWMQLDLGKSYLINKIHLWRYFADGRIYNDSIIQVSNDPNFNTGVTTVFNNDGDNSAGQGVGTDSTYAESANGKEVPFNSVNARYVRIWTNGSNANIYNHIVEVKVYGVESQ